MPEEYFEALVEEEFPHAVPEQFRALMQNVALLIEKEPSPELRAQEGLSEEETLLGFYRGIPTTARGDFYGMGATLPDTITLFRLPIEEEAQYLCKRTPGASQEAMLRKVVRDTIWHEVAHHFGYNEGQVNERERKRE